MSEIPEGVLDDVVSLSQKAIQAVDQQEISAYQQRRDDLLAPFGYTCRIRTDNDGEVLVCYPKEWLDGDTINIDKMDDLTQAIERPIFDSPSERNFSEIEQHNRAIASGIAKDHGPIHGTTASAFADFMSNHYKQRIEEATVTEFEEFRTEYFPRNAWPSDVQKRVLDETIQLLKTVDIDRYE